MRRTSCRRSLKDTIFEMERGVIGKAVRFSSWAWLPGSGVGDCCAVSFEEPLLPRGAPPEAAAAAAGTQLRDACEG
jgi:hypothetical protein